MTNTMYEADTVADLRAKLDDERKWRVAREDQLATCTRVMREVAGDLEIWIKSAEECDHTPGGHRIRDMIARLTAARAEKAEVTKIAVTSDEHKQLLSDLARLQNAIQAAGTYERGHIELSIGRLVIFLAERALGGK